MITLFCMFGQHVTQMFRGRDVCGNFGQDPRHDPKPSIFLWLFKVWFPKTLNFPRLFEVSGGLAFMGFGLDLLYY